MKWIGLLFFTTTAQADVPVVIKVDDDVQAIKVSCPDGTDQFHTPSAGKVTLDMLPKDCTVFALRKLGVIQSVGEWTCTSQGCFLDVPPHKPVTNADGRVNLIFLNHGNAKTMELSCSGYRERTGIDDFTATFDGVPKGDCVVYAKGGSTAKSQPLGWGTYACTLSGPALICQPYTK